MKGVSLFVCSGRGKVDGEFHSIALVGCAE